MNEVVAMLAKMRETLAALDVGNIMVWTVAALTVSGLLYVNATRLVTGDGKGLNPVEVAANLAPIGRVMLVGDPVPPVPPPAAAPTGTAGQPGVAGVVWQPHNAPLKPVAPAEEPVAPAATAVETAVTAPAPAPEPVAAPAEPAQVSAPVSAETVPVAAPAVEAAEVVVEAAPEPSTAAAVEAVAEEAVAPIAVPRPPAPTGPVYMMPPWMHHFEPMPQQRYQQMR